MLVGREQPVGALAGGPDRRQLRGEQLPRFVEQRRLVHAGDVAVFGDHAPATMVSTTSLPSSQCTNCSRQSLSGVNATACRSTSARSASMPGAIAPRSSARRVARAPPRHSASRISVGRGPVVAVQPGDVVDQAGGLGDGPDVDGVVADRLVGAERDRDAVIQHRPPRQHAAAEPQVADRVVHHG